MLEAAYAGHREQIRPTRRKHVTTAVRCLVWKTSGTQSIASRFEKVAVMSLERVRVGYHLDREAYGERDGFFYGDYELMADEGSGWRTLVWNRPNLPNAIYRHSVIRIKDDDFDRLQQQVERLRVKRGERVA